MNLVGMISSQYGAEKRKKVLCQRKETWLTLLSPLHPGSPRSRAKAHIIREAEATTPTPAKTRRIVTIATIAVPPPTEFTASVRTGTKGYAEVLLVAVSRSAHSKKAMIKVNARIPLIITLQSIDRGTFTEADFTSSDICSVG